MSADKELHNKVNGILDEQWRDMRNGISDTGKAFVLGTIEMAHRLGILSDLEADGWEARIQKCPGHDDEGGRSWCAYCGDNPEYFDEGFRTEEEMRS